jgi:hypothetical protein
MTTVKGRSVSSGETQVRNKINSWKARNYIHIFFFYFSKVHKNDQNKMCPTKYELNFVPRRISPLEERNTKE